MAAGEQTVVPRFVYRALHQDEDESLGLRGRSPAASTPAYQAINAGSKERHSQYVHTTKSPTTALYYAEAFGRQSGHKMVMIDLQHFRGHVLDVSNEVGCQKHGIQLHSKAFNFATKHQEVLLVGFVAPTCIISVKETTHLAKGAMARSRDEFAASLSMATTQTLRSWQRDDVLWRQLGKAFLGEDEIKSDDNAQSSALLQVEKHVRESIGDAEVLQRRIQLQLEKLKEEEQRVMSKKRKLDEQFQAVKRRQEEQTVRQKRDEERKKEAERLEREHQLEMQRQEQEEAERKAQAEREAEAARQLEWERSQRGTSCDFSLYNPNFVDENFDETCTCVATNGDSTIMLYESGDWAFTNLPRQLYNKLHGRACRLPSPTFVALGSQDRYYIRFADGKSQWCGPDSLSEALHETDRTVKCIAFGEDWDSWFVVFTDGWWRCNDVPEGLSNKIEARDCRSDLDFVSLGPNGEWMLAVRNGRMWWGGLSDEGYEAIDQVKDRITFADFGNDRSYFIRYEWSDQILHWQRRCPPPDTIAVG